MCLESVRMDVFRVCVYGCVVSLCVWMCFRLRVWFICESLCVWMCSGFVFVRMCLDAVCVDVL